MNCLSVFDHFVRLALKGLWYRETILLFLNHTKNMESSPYFTSIIKQI